VDDEFITLTRRVGLAKLAAAKTATYYYRTPHTSVEKEAEIQQLAATYVQHPRMKMRVYLSRDSEHVIVVSDTKRLQYGYRLSF
jgi:hypothetical protein